MNECYYACKQIAQLCDEAQMKGKKVIRVNKIINIVYNALMADLENSIENSKTVEQTI